MDKRTRVFNAMDKKEVDHVPVGFWYHFSGEEAQGERCVQAHLDFYRETDADIIKIMSDGFYPYPITAKIEKASDWYNLKPLGKDHPYIQGQVWRAKRIQEEVGGECALFYNIFPAFSQLRFELGDELVMQHLREDKDAVLSALEMVTQDTVSLVEQVITEAKMDGVYCSVQAAELWRFSYEEYREIVTPADLKVINRANELSDYNILHFCGWAGDKNRLEVWRDYPGKTVNWAVHVEDLSMEQGREYFGGRCCLGGFANTRPAPIFYGTKKEIADFTHGLINSFGKTGLIIGADCTIPAEVSNERMAWVVEAARQI